MKNKKVLMFGPAFFGYRESIADELRTMGAEVDLYDERPNNGAFCKVMLRYNLRVYHPAVMRYYKGIIEKNRNKHYDYVFVIKSEAIDDKVFGLLKNAYPQAQFILYLWDSVENVPDGEKKIRLYDRVLTFDHVDAEKFNIPLRPLFFRKEYEAGTVVTTREYMYDVAFIGTAHSIRPRVVGRIAEISERDGRTCFQYLFLPHIIVFFYNKLLNRAYRNVKRADIHFEPMSADEIRKIYDSSKCILDVEHVAQRGLTMRTIEMVGLGKKLITTNTGIAKYDFYNPHNICIIDRDNPNVDDEFWLSDYEPVPQDTLRRYSLHTFVQDIFDLKEQKHGE